jgi:hypothetical protein
VVAISEVIVNLELYLNEGRDDPGRIDAMLKVLAQGLGTIPDIQRFIEFLNNP